MICQESVFNLFLLLVLSLGQVLLFLLRRRKWPWHPALGRSFRGWPSSFLFSGISYSIHFAILSLSFLSTWSLHSRLLNLTRVITSLPSNFSLIVLLRIRSRSVNYFIILRAFVSALVKSCYVLDVFFAYVIKDMTHFLIFRGLPDNSEPLYCLLWFLRFGFFQYEQLTPKIVIILYY